jgi:hypothetical protein
MLMSIKEKYKVKSIDTFQTKEWCLKKHYAGRMPSISYAFGLFDGNIPVGVCTFGMPPNYMEMKAWEPFELLELNRLVVNDGLPENSLSFFVGQCLSMLPKPKVIISYSDFRMGHNGYIYQATNWLYTGVGGEGQNIYIMKDGTERHQRHEDKINMELVERIEKTTGKARYYYFCADKRTKRKMTEQLRFPILPYPKGENKRYDSSYSPTVQTSLF